MFAQCTYQETMRALGPLTSPETISYSQGSIGNPNAAGFFWVIRITARTAGSVAVQAVGGTSTSVATFVPLGADLADTYSGGSANGYHYLELDGPIPIYGGLVVTPSGGFDGNIEVIAAGSAQT